MRPRNCQSTRRKLLSWALPPHTGRGLSLAPFCWRWTNRRNNAKNKLGMGTQTTRYLSRIAIILLTPKQNRPQGPVFFFCFAAGLCLGGAFNILRSASSNGMRGSASSGFLSGDLIMSNRTGGLVSGLSERQYAAIGKVACEWSHLDLTLREYMKPLANVPQNAAWKIAIDLGSVSLMNMILALAHDETKPDDQQPPIYQHLIAMAESINALRGERNLAVHGGWLRSRPGVAASLKMRAEGRLVGKVVSKRVTEFEDLARRISSMNRKLFEVIQHFQSDQLQPLPPKSKKRPRQGYRSDPTSLDKTPASRPKPFQG